MGCPGLDFKVSDEIIYFNYNDLKNPNHGNYFLTTFIVSKKNQQLETLDKHFSEFEITINKEI